MTEDLRQAAARFQQKSTPYLKGLAQISPAIASIYTYDPNSEDFPVDVDRDILNERQYSPVKGAIHKFPGRLVVLLSFTCAANCRYCERQDRVGVGLDNVGYLGPEEISNIVTFIENTPSITEVIVSGGDPLTNGKGLRLLANLLSELKQVRIFRIHTRLPVQQPALVDRELLGYVCSLFDICYFSIHIDHPDELTTEAVQVLTAIRKQGYIMLAQSVFLRGVNDQSLILAKLFSRLAELGIRPYYIYHCQAIPTTKRFVIPLDEEITIMTTLREILSGIAFPQHVVDLHHARGKVLVPTHHWSIETMRVRDFDACECSIEPER